MPISYLTPCCLECFKIARRALNKTNDHSKVTVWLRYKEANKASARKTSGGGMPVCTTCHREKIHLSYETWWMLMGQRSSQDEWLVWVWDFVNFSTSFFIDVFLVETGIWAANLLNFSACVLTIVWWIRIDHFNQIWYSYSRIKLSDKSDLSMLYLTLRFEASYLEQLIALSKIFVKVWAYQCYKCLSSLGANHIDVIVFNLR
jgi:hypothetical protein